MPRIRYFTTYEYLQAINTFADAAPSERAIADKR